MSESSAQSLFAKKYLEKTCKGSTVCCAVPKDALPYVISEIERFEDTVDLLKCPICNEGLGVDYDAIYPSCGHAVCLKCFERHRDSENGFRDIPNYQCMVCRTMHTPADWIQTSYAPFKALSAITCKTCTRKFGPEEVSIYKDHVTNSTQTNACDVCGKYWTKDHWKECEKVRCPALPLCECQGAENVMKCKTAALYLAMEGEMGEATSSYILASASAIVVSKKRSADESATATGGNRRRRLLHEKRRLPPLTTPANSDEEEEEDTEVHVVEHPGTPPAVNDGRNSPMFTGSTPEDWPSPDAQPRTPEYEYEYGNSSPIDYLSGGEMWNRENPETV